MVNLTDMVEKKPLLFSFQVGKSIPLLLEIIKRDALMELQRLISLSFKGLLTLRSQSPISSFQWVCDRSILYHGQCKKSRSLNFQRYLIVPCTMPKSYRSAILFTLHFILLLNQSIPLQIDLQGGFVLLYFPLLEILPRTKMRYLALIKDLQRALGSV